MKQMSRKIIKETDLQKYPELAGRVFCVSCRSGIYHTERCFEKKHNLKRFIDNPELSNIVIQVCDTRGVKDEV